MNPSENDLQLSKSHAYQNMLITLAKLVILRVQKANLSLVQTKEPSNGLFETNNGVYGDCFAAR